jgi:hypothetical protein
MAKSGRDVGADHVKRLQEYLSSTAALPLRNGKVNATAIAKACGFDRNVLYTNPGAKSLLDAAAARIGAEGIDVASRPADGDDRARLQRKINKLEQEAAANRAEIDELRRRLRRLEHVETHFMETGRRIIP